MDMKQNPFSVYDFLGYFTPGALSLYGGMVVYAHAKPELNISDYIAATLSFKNPELYIPFVLVAYTIGHILSFISSGIVERYSIWSLGYPSKFLLGEKPPGYFEIAEHKCLRTAIRIAVAAFLAPITLPDKLLSQFGFRDLYAKALDKILVNVIINKVDGLMQYHGGIDQPSEEADVLNADSFRYVYHYTVEHAPNHLPKMQNYVALYGFLRTLTLLMVMLFWSFVWHVHVYIGLGHYNEAFAGVAISGLLAFVVYMAFVKFYRRFSLEAFMALAASFAPSTRNTPSKQ